MQGGNADLIIDGGDSIPWTDIQNIIIDPENGDILVTTISKDWNLVSGDPGPNTDPKPVVNLTVNGSGSASVTLGTAVQFSWSVTTAASCTTQSGNTAWQNLSVPVSGGNASGAKSIVIDYTGLKSFTLRCVNGSSVTTDSVTVTGTDPVEPPPNTECGATPTNVQVSDWEDIEWGRTTGYQWPVPHGNTTIVNLGSSQILALKINTATAKLVNARHGNLGFAEAGVLDPKEIAIASCPGDFAVLKGCTKNATNGKISWEIEDGKNGLDNYVCDLDQGTSGKTYYVNIRFPNGCGQSQCQTYISSAWYE
jgi:hypothetical protein